MTTSTPPPAPAYRVTLFYGPEPVDGEPSAAHCVFNVKKRSWKAGVQIDVQLDESQLRWVRDAVGFDAWLGRVLHTLPQPEREAWATRARDYFVQAVAALKLDLALAVGLEPENQRLLAGRLVHELEQAALDDPDRLTAYVRTELDLTAG